MDIITQIVIYSGIAIVIFAIFGFFFSGSKPQTTQPKGKENKNIPERQAYPKEEQLAAKEDKTLKLQEQVISLQAELGKAKIEYGRIENELAQAKQSHSGLQEEAKKSQGWVAKSDETINKVKEENTKLKEQFLAKEHELQDEFTKGVNLNRELSEVKQRLKTQESENKEKSDRIEAMKHQIAKYSEDIKTHLDTVAKLQDKENINAWVPKAEFNKLNEEYTELENDLEAKNAKMQSLLQELSQIKNELKNRAALKEPVKGETPEKEPQEKLTQEEQEKPAQEQLPAEEEKSEGTGKELKIIEEAKKEILPAEDKVKPKDEDLSQG